jgi:Pyruvate/2-oxoacid:ferredoxin oxidoreductase delta subunit
MPLAGFKQRILVFKLSETVLALYCTACLICLKECQKVEFSALVIVLSVCNLEHITLAGSEASVIASNS